LVDAFAEHLYEGNPAGVVTDARGLSEQQMLAIAKELNASTTGFVVGCTGNEEYQIRFFTPLTEIDLCGHVTIALFYSLALDGRIMPPRQGLAASKAVTKAGPICVQTQFEGSMPAKVMMALNPARLSKTGLRTNYIARSLGFPVRDIDKDRPIQIAHTGLRHLLVSLRSLESVEQLAPEASSISVLGAKANVDTVCAFSTETKDLNSAAHARDFTAPIGHYEEPASGTTMSALATYLIKQGLVQLGDDTTRLAFEQGFEMKRPSIIHVQVYVRNSLIREINVGGAAKVAMSGKMLLN